MHKTLAVKVRIEIDQYSGVFKKQDKRGRWRKFDSIGNAGVALDIATFLRKLGHEVETVYLEEE